MKALNRSRKFCARTMTEGKRVAWYRLVVADRLASSQIQSLLRVCSSSVSRGHTPLYRYIRTYIRPWPRDERPTLLLKMSAKLEKTGDLAGKDARPAESLLPQLLPRPVPRDRIKEKCGGYDCEFVEPPQKAFQTKCPVCLQILKEPHLISCCGHKFCRECIERIEKEKKPCPLCNVPDFTFMRERGLERSLKELEVWCSYREEGCEWKGKLGELEEHLNRDPSPENQLKECQFVEVECTHKCGEWFQRRHITTHETQQCKKRPYSCDHCRDYDSTFEDVTEVHYPQCGKYPVSCPNDCDVSKIE